MAWCEIPSASMPNAPRCSSILRTTLLPLAMFPVSPIPYLPGQALMRGILVLRVGNVKQTSPSPRPVGHPPPELRSGEGEGSGVGLSPRPIHVVARGDEHFLVRADGNGCDGRAQGRGAAIDFF